MKTIVINENGLLDSQLDKKSSKSRAILVDGNKILIANYGGVILLPGGSMDKGETETQAVLRELQEETGMTYGIQDLRKIISLKYYQSNYPTRDGKTTNRLITTYYYLGKFKGIDLSNIQRTKKEKKDSFSLELLEFDELHRRLDDTSDNPRRQYFDREMREVLNAYKEILINENDKIEIDER